MTASWTILDRDDDLVVVAKPTGLATIRERDPGRPDLHGQLQESLGQRVWIVHRLDKDTSGLVVFALTADTHRALSRAFEAREVDKTYLAVVHGDPGPEGAIRTALRTFGSGRTGVDAERGKPAETVWRALRRVGPWTELEVHPRTGRRHQIRAHLHSIGHSVVGDPLYGAPDQRRLPGRMLLHAARLGLDLPPGPPRAWTCDPPEDYRARVAAAAPRT